MAKSHSMFLLRTNPKPGFVVRRRKLSRRGSAARWEMIHSATNL
ncbi:hypothetical protein RB10126 [Rhodopirellula baltica SH 1]|uniref:Uncharacterized protein n=1 Tax=Rhodopirellula baltica (strain DSM 10527 / NCIMB 13988 / SH1) TaxID=243090 RepID=Q7UKI8_RHOBA|nr:hypothetical protein RB10126 [Rhodopirellula baltica SH 1]